MKKTMKVALVAGLIIFGATTANAQLGIQAGYVNTKSIVNDDGKKESSDPVNGFRVGLMYNMPIQGGFSLQYGLNYALFMDKQDGKVPGIKTSFKSREHHLDIPFHVAYAFSINDNFKIFLSGGPRFDFGLLSKTKADMTVPVLGDLNFSFNHYNGKIDTGNLSQEMVNFINENIASNMPQQNRFDLLLGLSGGVQFKNIYLKAGYDWGMLNLLKEAPDKFSLKRNEFNVSLGYQF